MSYNVYLGDIDPNLQMSEALKVRREIFFKLLLWDSVVLSDSQLLTDPRIIRLMSGFTVHKGEMADHSPIKAGTRALSSFLSRVWCRLPIGQATVGSRRWQRSGRG